MNLPLLSTSGVSIAQNLLHKVADASRSVLALASLLPRHVPAKDEIRTVARTTARPSTVDSASDGASDDTG